MIESGRYAAERRRKREQGRPKTRDFLGLTHCCGTKLQGKLHVLRLTAKLTAIRDKLCQRRHEPVSIVGAWRQRVLNGYLAYHAVPTNLLQLTGFCSESVALGGMLCCAEVNDAGSTGLASIG